MQVQALKHKELTKKMIGCAMKEVDHGDYNQIINYLRIFKIEVSLPLNFGLPSLYFKRFVNSNIH